MKIVINHHNIYHGVIVMNQLAIHKSNLMYFRFGPIIAHHKLSSDFISELNKRGNNTSIDHSMYLAGHIEKENELSMYN